MADSDILETAGRKKEKKKEEKKKNTGNCKALRISRKLKK